MPILEVDPATAAHYAYVHRPDFINEPTLPPFIYVNRGTSRQLLINLATVLDEAAGLVEHDALEGPFGGAGSALASIPGIDGVDGEDGLDGFPGAEGAAGAPGADGSDGAAGFPGVDGVDGTDGLDGFPGAAGSDGAPGAPGAGGADGTDGAPGLDGLDGADGSDGVPGLPGLDGTDGVGVPGLDGLDGADGFDGIPGLPGAAGAAGAAGADGADGAVFGLNLWFDNVDCDVVLPTITADNTIAFVTASTPDTMTIGGGADLVTLGFVAGMKIRVSGGLNDGRIYVILSVAAGALTFIRSTAVVNEAAGAAISIQVQREKLTRVPVSGVQITESVLVNSDVPENTVGAAIDSYVTPPLVPGTVTVPAGLWTFRFWAYADSQASNSYIHFVVSKISALGIETVLFTTIAGKTQITSLVGSTNAQKRFVHPYAMVTDSTILTTDRLVVRVVGTVATNARTISFIYQGTAMASYIETPLAVSAPAGPAGAAGTPGVDGMDGIDGLDGVPGVPGADGAPGPGDEVLVLAYAVAL